MSAPGHFTVRKDLPMPETRAGHGSYPFAQMDVGDSFTAPRDMGSRGSTDNRQKTITCSARSYAKRHNPSAKFTVRLIDAETVGCWRIA